MHTLFLDSHVAVLDQVTGLGVLLLPDPVYASLPTEYPITGTAVEVIAPLWFGPHWTEHTEVAGKLASIGWDLPQDNDGALAWYDAGCTDCCGRFMLSLVGADPHDRYPSLSDLLATSRQILEVASVACCGLATIASSVTQWLQDETAANEATVHQPLGSPTSAQAAS